MPFVYLFCFFMDTKIHSIIIRKWYIIPFLFTKMRLAVHTARAAATGTSAPTAFRYHKQITYYSRQRKFYGTGIIRATSEWTAGIVHAPPVVLPTTCIYRVSHKYIVCISAVPVVFSEIVKIIKFYLFIFFIILIEKNTSIVRFDIHVLVRWQFKKIYFSN